MESEFVGKKDLEIILKKLPGYTEIQEYIEKTAKQYAPYLKSAEEVRKMMDKKLGAKSLSRLILRMRE